MIKHSLQVVLHSPQIPPNTGNIARTCAATNTTLHLIKPIGFDLSDKAVKRAGLDYWDLLSLVVHESWPAFLSYKSGHPGKLVAYSPAGLVHYHCFKHSSDDLLVHGREADGLPKEVLGDCSSIIYIPMYNPGVRSLNLAVCASLSLYQALSLCN